MSSAPQPIQTTGESNEPNQSTGESNEPRPWTVIVPVKELHLAKSRLSALGATARRRLAQAFALDTVAAAMQCAWVDRVVVVTNDPIGSLFVDRGCVVIPDVPDAGLNPALTFAGDEVRASSPHACLAAISSDLPSLRPVDLASAFGAAPPRGWFVADSQCIGTTMVGAPAGANWQPTFGGESRRAHLDRGMVEVDVAGIDRLRLDVDTTADLELARRLGVGPETTAVLGESDSLG